jgi:potassium/hydrogen antiporter
MLEAMNLAIFIGSALVVAAVFTSLLSFRFGAPLLLVFLVVGLLAGEDGPLGIEFDNGSAAFFVGALALAIILFDSGFETRMSTLRIAAAPAVVLATMGVILTAGLVAVSAVFLFGWTWAQGLLLGAIVAPTDAAAVFFLLRVGGITLRDRVRSTLEVESGTNDPIAIFLTLVIVEWMIGAETGNGLAAAVFADFLIQIGIGSVVGFAGGTAIAQVVNRTRFEPALYPIIVLAMALSTYAIAGMIGGSGFLAVYVAGLVAGNSRIRHAVALKRFQQGTTWLSQIAMFLTLGLLATPSQFPAVAGSALGIALFLTFIARPFAVWVCLLPFGFSRNEMAFVSWVGLRGAVSILLAIPPVVAGLTGAQDLFNAAFIIVLFSLLVQGWTIGPVARFLGLVVPPRRGPVDRIELELPGRGNHEIVAYVVHPESPVAKGQRIPRWARPALLVRDGRALQPDRAGRPQPGDQVYIITIPDYIGLLDRLFAGRAEGAGDPQLYGEFAIAPDTKLTDLAREYGAPVSGADIELTVAELLRRELAGDIEQGDRIAYGPIDVIVRSVNDEHGIEEVGLALEHSRAPQRKIPVFQTPRELADLIRRTRRRRGQSEAVMAEPPTLPDVEGAQRAGEVPEPELVVAEVGDIPVVIESAAVEPQVQSPEAAPKRKRKPRIPGLKRPASRGNGKEA